MIDTFEPQHDADGNQTLIKTSTGIWSVTYNAENSPVRWVGATHFRGPLRGASRARMVQAVACLMNRGL